MPRWVKWLLGVVATLVVLVGAAAVAVPFLVDTPRIQAYIATTAAQTLGRPVKFSSVSLRVLPLPAVELHELEVAEDPKFGTAPFLRLDTGRVRLRLMPLLTGRVELGDIVLKKPVITVIQSADGRLNIATLGPTSEPRAPPRPGRSPGAPAAGGAVAVSRVLVDDGLVTYLARGKGDAPAQYRLSALDLTLTGGGTQIAFRGKTRLQPGDVSLALSDGIVSLAGTRPLTEASLRGKVAIDGKDVTPLAAVAVGPTPTIGGGAKGTLALGGTGGAPTVRGEIALSPLTVTQTSAQCPEPKRRTLTIPTVKLNAGWQEQRFTSRPLTATLGGGTVTTRLTAALDRGVHVELADLGIKALPLEKVLVDYLCEGYAVAGPLDLSGTLSFEARDMLGTLTGPGQFRIGSGKVVGPQALALIGGVVRVGGAVSTILSADLPASAFDSPLEFESITGTYTLASGVATTRDLLYTSRAMKVAIAGTYGLATGALNLDMTVNHGRGQLQAKVTGTTSSPSIRVSPASVLRDVDPQKAERGIKDLLKRFGK
jgi:AsmA family/AsmA-like C-terminal region